MRTPADPEPEFHAHPDVAPDELDDRAVAPVSTNEPAHERPLCMPVVVPHVPRPHVRIRSGPPMTNHIPTEIVMRPVRERLQCYRLCSAEAVRRGRAVRGIVVTFMATV